MKLFLIFTVATSLGLSSALANPATGAKKKSGRAVSSDSACSCEREAYAAAYKELVSDMATNLSDSFGKLTLKSAGCTSTKKNSSKVSNTVSIGIETPEGMTSRQYNIDLDTTHDNACVVKSVIENKESQ